jgi:hypothetical protein
MGERWHNHDQIRAQRVDLVGHLGLRAVADGHHDDDGRHADDKAQHGEKRADLVEG